MRSGRSSTRRSRSSRSSGTRSADNVHSLTGSGLTLLVGILLTLWGGLGVMNAMQTGMNRVWDVPLRDRPNFWKSRIRALLMLVLLGSAAVASAIIAGVTAAAASAGLVVTGGYLLSLALNLGVFLVSFRILSARKLSWGDVFPGACVAAVAGCCCRSWAATSSATSSSRRARSTACSPSSSGCSPGWPSVGRYALRGGGNVVRKERLWPRSLFRPPLSEADERTYRRAAIQEERLPEESVKVQFDHESEEQAEHEDRKERSRTRDVEEKDASSGT